MLTPENHPSAPIPGPTFPTAIECFFAPLYRMTGLHLSTVTCLCGPRLPFFLPPAHCFIHQTGFFGAYKRHINHGSLKPSPTLPQVYLHLLLVPGVLGEPLGVIVLGANFSH
jgi:hypothetical protein